MRVRRGVIHEYPLALSHAPVPVTPAAAVIAPIMNCMHIEGSVAPARLANDLDVLLRHRLLPQPGGFEGCSVAVSMKCLAILDRTTAKGGRPEQPRR